MRASPHRSFPVAATCLLAFVALAAASRVHAQTVRHDFWVTNGVVNAALASGNTLWVGGEFTHVGPATGPGVPIDAATGLPVTGFPAVDGCVYAAVADGAGGWYIGGTFNSVGGVSRQNLAHVLSDMTLSPWDPQPNTTVLAVALSGSTVYFGGFFTEVAGQNRQLVAAVDATSGELTSFDAAATRVGFDSVRSIVIQGGAVYVAGSFSSMGGQSRASLAALDPTTGHATTWDAKLQGGIPGGTVLSLAASASTLYLCGNFGSVGGQSRSYVGAVDLGTGLATSWDAHSDDQPLALALDGNLLYVAGQFTHIGGADRRYLAALDATSAEASPWNPGADHWTFTLAVSGSTIYAGGDFTILGGAPRHHVGAIDAGTGLATSWDPNADDWVGIVAVSGSAVYAGGIYRSLGGVTRHNLAAIDIPSGMATDWNPDANGAVQALALSGSTLYAGGWFGNVGGQTRPYVAALDVATGDATAWNPTTDGTVEALATDGAVVYLGGSFAHAGGDPRTQLAAVDAGTGLTTGWDPGADAPVHALALDGTAVYAGGSFKHAGGQARDYVAALDPATGAATTWNPDADYNVYALALDGTTLYAGGRFGNIGGQARNNLAALSTQDGQATGWNPNPDGGVLALALGGSTVYAGGDFLAVGGQAHPYLAAIDAGTGQSGAWDPQLGTAVCPNGADATVNALTVSGVTILAGGAFSNLASLPRGYLVALGDVTTPTQVALVSAEAAMDRVRLVWYTASGGSFGATVYRRGVIGDWQALAQVSADGNGQVVYEDHAVTAGARYAYRLGVVDAGTESFFGETWVDVPAAAVQLALAGSRPHPAGQDLTVELSLPDGAAARLDLLDIAGRRLVTREVGALGVGQHTVTLARGHSLAPGVYLLRLTRGERALTVRAVVVG